MTFGVKGILQLLEKGIEKAPFSATALTGLTVHFTADENGVVTDYFNILPENLHIVTALQKTETLTLAPDYD